MLLQPPQLLMSSHHQAAGVHACLLQQGTAEGEQNIKWTTLRMKGGWSAPARTPTQVERKRREVVSVGLRSCPSIARRSSTTNCVIQLRMPRRTHQLKHLVANDAACGTAHVLRLHAISFHRQRQYR